MEGKGKLFEMTTLSEEKSAYLLSEGINKISSGMYDEAKPLFEKSLELNPANTASRLFLYALTLNDGFTEEGEEILRSAPDFSSALSWKLLLAHHLFRRGKNLDEACQIVKDASPIFLLPEAVLACRDAGRGELIIDLLKHFQGKLPPGIGTLSCERALHWSWYTSRDPELTGSLLEIAGELSGGKLPFLHYSLERSLFLKDWEKALEVFEEVAQNTENSEEKAVLLSSMSWIKETYLEDEKAALEGYLESVLLKPSKEVLQRALRLARKLNDETAEEKILEKYLEHYPDESSVRKRMAEVMWNKGEAKRAIEILEPIASDDPHSARLFITLLEDAGLWKKEEEFLSGLLEKEFDLPLALRLAEIKIHKLSDFDGAEELLKRIIEKAQDPQALNLLAFIYREKRKWKELIEVIDRLLTLTTDPKAMITYLMEKGEIYEFHLMDAQSAVSIYEELYEIAPSHLPVIDALRRLYRKKKMWKKLMWINDARRKLISDSAEHMALIRENAEIALFQLADGERLAHYLQEIIDFAPGDLDAILFLLLLSTKGGDELRVKTLLEHLIADETFPENIRRISLSALILLTLRTDPAESQPYMDQLMKFTDLTESEWTILWLAGERSGEEEKIADLVLEREKEMNDPAVKCNQLMKASSVFKKRQLEEKLEICIAKLKEIPSHDLSDFIELLSGGDLEGSPETRLRKDFTDPFLKDLQCYARAAVKGESESLLSCGEKMAKELFSVLNAFYGKMDLQELKEGLSPLNEKERNMVLSLLSMLDRYDETISLAEPSDEVPAELYTAESIRKKSLQALDRAMNHLSQHAESLSPEEIAAVASYYESQGEAEKSIGLLEKLTDTHLKTYAILKQAELFEKLENFKEKTARLISSLDFVKESERRREIRRDIVNTLFEKVGDPEGAVYHALEFLKEFPGDEGMLTYTENQLLSKGLKRECVDFLLNASGHFPEDMCADIYMKAAHLAREGVKDYQLALNALKEGTNALPNNLKLAREYSKLLEEGERWEELLQELERRLHIEPVESHPDIFFKRGEIFEFKLKDEEKAIAEYLRSVEIHPEHLPSCERLLHLFSRRNEHDTAFRFAEVIYRNLAEFCPDTLAVAGNEYLGKDDFEIARTLFEKGLEKDPRHLPSIKGLLQIHEKKGEWENYFHLAGRFAEEIEKENPNLASEIYTESGRVAREKLNNPDEAMKRLRKAIKLNPSSFNARFLLSDILVKDLRRHREAVPEVRAALMLEPENAMLWHHLAECHYIQKQHDHHFVALDLLTFMGDISETEKKLHEVALKKARTFPDEPFNWDELDRLYPIPGDLEELSSAFSGIEKVAWNITGTPSENLSDLMPVPEHDKTAIDIRSIEKIMGVEKSQILRSKDSFLVSSAGKAELVLPEKGADDTFGRKMLACFGLWVLRKELTFLVFNKPDTILKVIKSLASYFDVQLSEDYASYETIEEKVVKKALSWKARFEVKGKLKKIAEFSPQDILKLQNTLTQSAFKFACGTIGYPSRMVKASEHFPFFENPLQEALRVPLVETFYAQRRVLKLSII